jgi:thiol-disulfide isomerase/thioredoxin
MNRADRRRGAPGTQSGPDRRRIIVFGTLAVIAIGIIVAFVFASRVPPVASVPTEQAQIKVGQVAPPFSVSTTDGPRAMPAADGKPVLLEVFATWCPHCQRETAILNELFTKYGGRVDFVAVSGSPYAADEQSPESQADVVAFGDHFKVKYPLAYDGDLKVMKAYLQGGYPTIVMIGRDGKIRAIRDGEIAPKTLSGDMDAALKV